ncbi:MAG TPA: ABC transporter substrate-binding protein [Capsulimonadaceae bacterium]|nr:ABC transporter substrate-binding protein [Capsulimonadaceae bacterium]
MKRHSTERSARMINVRRLFAALILLSLAFFAGCGRSSDSSSDNSGPIVLDYWNGFTGPDGVTMTAMVNEFERENPDIQVKMQIIPWGTYYDKLTLSLAYGGAPDVFILQSARFPEFASTGTIRPLTDLYAQSGAHFGENQFTPVTWNESIYKGVHYSLPLDTFPIGMYYNTKLFQEAGIVDANGQAKPPTTLAEFLADAQKLTKDTTGSGRPDQWGFVFTNEHTNWLTFARQFGGDIVTPDGKAGEMSSPASLAATQLMCDLVYKYHVAPRPEGVNAWLAFQRGKVGMAMEGIYMLHSLQETTGLEFAGAPVPQFGPEKGAWGGCHMLCMPTGLPERKVQAAWRLMRFLSDHSLRWAQGGQTPARISVLDSPQFHDLSVQSQFASQISYVHFDPQIPKANALNQFADPAIDAALEQLQTPQDAMRDADRRIDQLLKRP